MLAEKWVSQKLEAWCPGCRSTYRGEILPFLYADELGTRCPTCGDVLAMEGSDGWRKSSGPCRLLLPECLGGSDLHRKLADLVGSGEGSRVLVDRMDETRIVRPNSLAPLKEFGSAVGDGTR